MANRLVFSPNLTIGKSKYTEAEYEFKYYTGFAVSQKQTHPGCPRWVFVLWVETKFILLAA